MTIEFNCDGCRYPFKVPDTMAGKKGKCPKCGALTTIPTSSSGSPIAVAPPPPPPGMPPPPAGMPPAYADERDYDYAPQPRRRKKSKKGLIIGLSIGAAVLLIGGGLLLWFLLSPSGPKSDELKFLPDKPIAIVLIKPAEFFSSALWKDLGKDLPAFMNPEKQIETKSGYAPKDIDRIMVGTDGEDVMIIVSMNKSVKAEDIQKSAKKGMMDFKDETKVGSYTMYKTAMGDDGPAFCIPSSSLVVGSNKAKALESVLKRNKKAEISSSFQKVIDKADFSKTFAVAVDVKALAKKASALQDLNFLMNRIGPGGPAGELAGLAEGLGVFADKVEGIAGNVKVSSGVDVSGTMFCNDADTAKEFKKMADEALKAAREHAPKEGLELLDKVKVSQSGNTVSGSVSISKSLIDKMMKH
jgi:hypothetical protein